MASLVSGDDHGRELGRERTATMGARADAIALVLLGAAEVAGLDGSGPARRLRAAGARSAGFLRRGQHDWQLCGQWGRGWGELRHVVPTSQSMKPVAHAPAALGTARQGLPHATTRGLLPPQQQGSSPVGLWGGAAGDDCCTITTAASRRKFRLWGSGAASRLMWITRHSTKGPHLPLKLGRAIPPCASCLCSALERRQIRTASEHGSIPPKTHASAGWRLSDRHDLFMLSGHRQSGPPQALRLSRAPPWGRRADSRLLEEDGTAVRTGS